MVEDHIHILCSLHRSDCIADIVKLIKNSATIMIKREGILPDFHGWQNGYGAFTVSWTERDALIDYIKHQIEHHKHEDFLTEFKKILDAVGIDYKDAYIQ
jgi:REP element-mobilizing transposase RayT